MKFYLGVVGSAKTSYVGLSNSDGEIINIIKAPPLTIRVNENLKYYLKITFDEMCHQIGIEFNDFITKIKSCCIAMSGVYFESDIYSLKQILEQIGFFGKFNNTICEDVNAHIAANFLPFGGVVIAGTGSNVFFRLKNINKPIRVDGWGSDLGDDGSGYYLGRLCLRNIFKGIDNRIPRSTVLEQYILDYLNLSKVEDLVQWFYNSRNTINWRSNLSDLAIPLIKAAEIENDKLSISILKEGIKALEKSFKIAMKRAKSEMCSEELEPFPIILEGGLFEHSVLYKNSFIKLINEYQRKGFKCIPVDPEYIPVIGSLAIAISGNILINPNLINILNLQKSADRFKCHVKTKISMEI